MKLEGVGRLCLWDGLSLWIGHGRPATDIHSHHAVQLTLALQGRLRMRTGPEWLSYRGAFVPPDLPHAMDGTGAEVAVIWIDPEKVEGRALLDAFGSKDISVIPDSKLDAVIPTLAEVYRETDDEDRLLEASWAVIGQLVPSSRARRPVDPRILKATELVRERLNGRVVQDEIASEVYLSPSRFRHLFVEETGIAFRPYILWARMQRVLREISAGESITNAAHAAGFSDLAHMSRTFRRMVGLSPTMALREDQFDATSAKGS